MTSINIELGDTPCYLATTLEEGLPAKLLISYLTERQFTGFVITLHLRYCSGCKGALDWDLFRGVGEFIWSLDSCPFNPRIGATVAQVVVWSDLNSMCQRALEQVCEPQNSSRCCVCGARARPPNVAPCEVISATYRNVNGGMQDCDGRLYEGASLQFGSVFY